MSTIEQAAKRLQQLRQSGVQIEPSVAARAPRGGEEDQAAESVPLRVAKALDPWAGGVNGVEEPDMTVALRDFENQGATPLLTGVPPGASAPVLKAKGSVEIDLARLAAEGIITPQAPRSLLAEQFRVIKRPLLTNARGKAAAPVVNANRIMVTSSVPAEGKTFVSVNLAMSLAMELDTHVLLVDADTSRPAVFDRLGLRPAKGLLDLLLDPALSFDAVVMSTNVERLWVLPAGKPHGQATELLASEAMNRLVERLAASDPRLIVLFDTPPLLVASESRVLAAHMGQVVMVVAADDTPQATVAEALSTIESCPVVLTVLNRSTTTEAKHYGYYGAYAPRDQ